MNEKWGARTDQWALPDGSLFEEAEVEKQREDALAALQEALRLWGDRVVFAGVSEGADVLWSALRERYRRRAAWQLHELPAAVLLCGGMRPYVYKRGQHEDPGPFIAKPVLRTGSLTLAASDRWYPQGKYGKAGVVLQHTTGAAAAALVATAVDAAPPGSPRAGIGALRAAVAAWA